MFNSIGAMYTASLFLGIQNAGGIQPVVSIERTVYYRERAAGIYSALPYALAQVTIELPYIFSQSLMYCIIVYAMMGYEWCFTKVLWFFFFMFFTFLYFTYYGMMTIAATPSYHIGMIISTAFYGMWNLFCGFIIPRTVSIFFEEELINESLSSKGRNDVYKLCIAEDSGVVEMVLLDLSFVMDVVWVNWFTIWRCGGEDGYRGDS